MTLSEFERRAQYQDGYDREFDQWKIIDIHHIPTEFYENHEVDFYCSNGKRVYLLRLRSRETEFYETKDTSQDLDCTPYLIAEFPIKNINNEVIKRTLDMFDIR